MAATRTPVSPSRRWRRARRRLGLLRVRVRTGIRSWVADAGADLGEALFGPIVGEPLPPRRLRAGVARSSARDEYLKAGALAAGEILAILLRAGIDGSRLVRWLDFGCGSGRLARILTASGAAPELAGVDVDEPAIRWCREHLEQGSFSVSAPRPPLEFPGASFDVAVAASVFTHFDAEMQLAWLDEMARVLAPGGYLVASTHHPRLAALRPEIDSTRREELERTGFLFQPGDGSFNDDAAFHSRTYLESTWTSHGFRLLRHEESRLFRFQDLSLWQKPESPLVS